jgi:putative SOS response-associated peptidase YedK
MKVVHIQSQVPEKVNKPSAKQAYHERMVAALRRRQYADFLKAQKSERVKEAVALARTVDPDYQPKFNK